MSEEREDWGGSKEAGKGGEGYGGKRKRTVFTLQTSFTLTAPSEAPSPNTSTLGVKASTYESGLDDIQSIC